MIFLGFVRRLKCKHLYTFIITPKYFARDCNKCGKKIIHHHREMPKIYGATVDEQCVLEVRGMMIGRFDDE